MFHQGMLILLAIIATPTDSFTAPRTSSLNSRLAMLNAQSTDNTNDVSSRRNMIAGTAFLAGSLFIPRSATAARGPATPQEIARIRKGYDGLEYLLANFDKETTKCTPECNRNPDAVRSYLGLRSMDHPLYQIEKVLQKAQDNLEDPDDLEAYVDAVENFASALSESNAMAYTSSFGEYNPGGGKDAVEKYLQLAKSQVILARDNLKIILEKLNA